MTIRLGVVMDPIAGLNYKKDSTLALLWAAQDRGWELHYLEQQDLFLRDGNARANTRGLRVHRDAARWFELGEPRELALGELDVVLMRKDPPFNNEYIYSTYILEAGARDGCLVINDPQSLRDCNEKLFATRFPQCCPPLLVSRDSVRLRAFQREHPDIFVKIVSTNNYTREVKLEDMTQLSDCFMWYRSPSAQEATNQLLDLRPLIDADTSFARDDIAPALWSVYEYEGGQYGLPYTYNLRVLNYNRTLFEQAGLPAPSADWTLDQFLQAAQALSKGEGTQRQYGFANPNNDTLSDLTIFSERFDARLVRHDGTTVLPNFSDPNTVKAIEWYIDLDKIHHVMPPLNIMYRIDGQGNPNAEEPYTLFPKNRVAMWFDFNKSSFDTYDETGKPIATVDVALAPIPVGKDGLRPGDIQLNGFHISKTAQSPQACWELIKFLSNDISFSYGSLPARKSLAQSEAFLAQAAPDRLEILKLYEQILQLSLIHI